MYVSTGSTGTAKGANTAPKSTIRAAQAGLIHCACKRGAAGVAVSQDSHRTPPAANNSGEAGQPDGKREREHSQDFLTDEGQRRQIDIAVRALDVRLQLQKWEVMLDVPQQVGQDDQEREQAGEPEPWRSELAAFGCGEQR